MTATSWPCGSGGCHRRFRRQHPFEYALFHGRDGERVVLFDNERGKGDHKHIREVETPYEFTTPDKLVEDFNAAVRAVRERQG